MNNVGEIIPPGEGTLPSQPAHHGSQQIDEHAENTADEAQLQEEAENTADEAQGNTASGTQPADHDITLSLAAQSEEGERELLVGGLDKKTFRAVATSIGRILADLLPEAAQIGEVLPEQA